MRVEQQPAFVLHARAYRETSLLLELFTREHGRIGLVARGVRRERSRVPRGVLQPLQPLLVDWVARGELGTLAGADAASAPFALRGDALLSAIYVNELILRLSGRNDPHPQAFAAYAECLSRLSSQSDIAWTLRRFERDFLADLGYALALAQTEAGDPIDAARGYAYDPDSGARPWRHDSRFVAVDGDALLALAADECPSSAHLAQLRRLTRHVVRHLIGGDLKAWQMTRLRSSA